MAGSLLPAAGPALPERGKLQPPVGHRPGPGRPGGGGVDLLARTVLDWQVMLIAPGFVPDDPSGASIDWSQVST